jgi:rubrerythrin
MEKRNLQCDPLEALNDALCREQEAHDFYVKAAQRTENSDGIEMFSILVDRAQVQIELLESQIETLTENNTWMLPECVLACEYDMETAPYPRDRTMFEKQIRPDTGEVDALLYALQAENTNYGVYTAQAQAAVVEEARQFYTYLAEQTRTRLDLLMLTYEGAAISTIS